MTHICRRSGSVALLPAALLFLAGCASAPSRMDAVPVAVTAQAEIPGMPGVRYVPGVDATGLFNLGVEGLRREQAFLAGKGHQGPLPPTTYLAVSGGGDNGAFTAGLLNGWTATGSRPEFKLVTGISTGALIAPFAFLGSKYDATLKEVYTTISPEDVLKPRSLLKGFFSDAMADNTPLWNLTRKTVNEALLKEIAAEYAKGRFLLIGTADIDARRPIIWDMGRIATYGGPEALDLFVVDAEASGHIVSQIGAPKVIADLVQVGLVRDQTQWMLDILDDPQRTGVAVVTTPEEMPVTETIDLLGRLHAETGAHASAVIANRVMPVMFSRREQTIVDRLDEVMPLLVDAAGPDVTTVVDAARLTESRRSTGAAHLDRLRSWLASSGAVADGLPIVTVGELFSRGSGPRVVSLVAEALTDELDPEPITSRRG